MSLDLVLGFDERVEQLVRMDDGLALISHQTDEGRVPLVENLEERGRPRAHQHLTNPVVELLSTCRERSLARATHVQMVCAYHRQRRVGTPARCAPWCARW